MPAFCLLSACLHGDSVLPAALNTRYLCVFRKMLKFSCSKQLAPGSQVYTFTW